jgi:hypothetical protein
MTTQPPQGPPSYQRPYYGQGIPQLTIPNPEFIVYVVVLLVLGLVTLVADSVVGSQWVEISAWVTIGYFLSRGLTKFGKGTEVS